MIKVLKLTLCIIAGYLSGSVNPAAILGKIKKVNLRNLGTGNLGATNVLRVFGKAHGAFVLVFDMSKAFFAVKLSQYLSPDIGFAGIAAGCAAVVGHIFPFYMKFKGGKGLAPYAGLILATDPLLFIVLAVICITLMVLVNYSVAMPLSAGILFPLISIYRTDSALYILIAFGVSTLIIIKHIPNIFKAIHGEDVKVREYIKGMFGEES